MNRLVVSLALLISAGTLFVGSAMPAAAAGFKIDPAHLTVAFMVEHIGYAKTLGFFQEAEGKFTYDENSRALSDVKIEIETASVFTNHARRDKHLRGKDFFDVKKHPTMIFEAGSATALDDTRYRIDGTLTLLGVTRPLSLEAVRNKAAKYPIDGKPFVLGVSATGTVKRSEFGMMYAVENGWVGDEVELIIEFEARQQ